METKNLFLILAAILMVIPVILLYMASFETPWTIQTWDGTSEKENNFRRRRRNRAIGGFTFLGIALFLQIIGILL